jgi:hypothetical protein
MPHFKQSTGLKLHKFKCFAENDVPLNPRQPIEEQLQDGDSVVIQTVASGLTPSSPSLSSSKLAIDGAPIMPEEGTLFSNSKLIVVTQEIGSIKRQLSQLAQGQEKCT